ncbi:MAG: S24 family peptidase [Sideroxydans sp.]|nr:S24 family peptidase [Sideroxydans sp.]
MQTRKPIDIPLVSADAQQGEQGGSSCDDKAITALMVLGVSMEPEFNDGEIIVIESGITPTEDAYVIAEVAPEDFIFRQLKRDAQGGWQLHALNPAYPDTAIPGLEIIRGVITQKRKAGSRKSAKFYGPQAGA